MSSKPPDDVLKKLDNLEVRRYHYFITILSDMGFLLDGYSLLVIGPALIFIPSQFHVSAAISAIIGVSTIIGQLLGGLIFGFLADLRGRKTIFQWDMVIFVIFSILSGLSTNALELIIFRAALGLAIGADYSLSLAIIGEYSPVKARGKLEGTGFTFWWLGAVIATLVGIATLPFGASAWRYLLAAGAVPAIIVLLLRQRIAETPRFALEKRPEELNEVAKQLNVQIEKAEAGGAGKSVKAFPLRRTIFTFSAWFINDLVFYGIGIYTSTLLFELHYSGHFGSLALTAILYTIGVISTLVFVFTSDIIGRKAWQEFGFLGMGIPLLLLAVYAVAVKHQPPLLLLFPLFAIFYFANAGGTGETTAIYVSELFPTRTRSTALGLGTAISRVGAIISSVLFPIMLAIYGPVPMEVFLGVFGVIGFIITLVLGEETKNRSLEEIAAAAR